MKGQMVALAKESEWIMFGGNLEKAVRDGPHPAKRVIAGHLGIIR